MDGSTEQVVSSCLLDKMLAKKKYTPERVKQ